MAIERISPWRGRSVWPRLAARSRAIFLALVMVGVVVAGPPAVMALEGQERALVGEAFGAAERGEWQRAFRLLAPVEDPLPAKTLRWRHMMTAERGPSFATLAEFLIANPHWPSPERLQIKAEGRITDPADHDLIRRFFADRAPITARGHIRYAQALFRVNDNARATEQLRQAWIEGSFSKREEARFLKRYRRVLTKDDHIARLDNLLWDQRRGPAARMLDRVPKAQRRLAEARLRLQRRRPGVDRAIEAVPAGLRNHAGLTYDRLRWRRHKRQDAGVLELLLDPPSELGRPQRWWFERELQIRRALRKRDFGLAYRLASRHGQTEGVNFAEAEWLAGWLALRFGKQPNTALRHFERVFERASPEIRQARPAYWAGRAAAMLGDPSVATEWYRRAARHHITYYGQLAAVELAEPLPPLPDPAVPTVAERRALASHELARVGQMLVAAGAGDELGPFLIRLAQQAQSPAEIGLLAELAMAGERPDLMARTGRYAAFYSQVNETVAFPVPEIAGLVRPPGGRPEPALLLSVARQESVFSTWVSSHAGADGLLQLIPRTAELMARDLDLPYNRALLTGDPDYNVRLGSHYLDKLLRRFDGEVALALVGYNAGPRRADRWLRLHGDPREGDLHDLIDWVELIPFDETRSYVQRVVEGRNMYRRRLAQPNLAMVPYPPINGPLEPQPVPAPKPLHLARLAQADGDTAVVPRPKLKPGPTARLIPARFSVPRPELKPAASERVAKAGAPKPKAEQKAEPRS